MSTANPIISVTGSSGAGTTSVKKTFERIFQREGIKAAYVEGDAFHRYNRYEMKKLMAEEAEKGNNHFSHHRSHRKLFVHRAAVWRLYGYRRHLYPASRLHPEL